MVPARPLTVAALLSIAAIAPLMGAPTSADSTTWVGRPLPERLYTTSAWDGHAAYVIGGQNGTLTEATDEILRYDPATGSVETLPAHLPRRMIGVGAVGHDEKVLIFGGYECSPCNILELDTATGVLTQRNATLLAGSSFHAAVWTGTVALLFGGFGASVGRIQRYDPATDQVTVMPTTLPSGFGWYVSAAWDGDHAYLVGGCCVGPSVGASDVLRYDPAADNLTVVGRLPEPAYGASSVFDGRFVLSFGARPCCVNALDVVRFDTVTGRLDVLPHRLSSFAPRQDDAVWTGTAAYVLGYLGGVQRYEPRPWPPMARIAPVSPAECKNEGALVSLDGRGSYDPEGGELTYGWSAPGVALDSSPNPVGRFPLGTTPVSLVVRSPSGSEATASVSVVVEDTRPPRLAFTRPTPGTVYVNDLPIVGLQGVRNATAVGPLTVVANSEDECGTASVEFVSSLDGTRMDIEPPYQFVSDPPVGAPVVAHVSAHATDLGGNTADAAVTFDQQGTRL